LIEGYATLQNMLYQTKGIDLSDEPRMKAIKDQQCGKIATGGFA